MVDLLDLAWELFGVGSTASARCLCPLYWHRADWRTECVHGREKFFRNSERNSGGWTHEIKVSSFARPQRASVKKRWPCSGCTLTSHTPTPQRQRCVGAAFVLHFRQFHPPGNIFETMEFATAPNITQLLVAWSHGDENALAQLTPLVYRELHRLAHRYMAGEQHGHLLQTTALVNEAYVRLIQWQQVEWQNRAHFFGVSATLMRNILVRFARDQQTAKRGGQEVHVSLSEAAGVSVQRGPDLVALDDALRELEKLDARHARIVELRFFGGLSLEETAEVLKLSVSTVRRDWHIAHTWLHQQLSATA